MIFDQQALAASSSAPADKAISHTVEYTYDKLDQAQEIKIDAGTPIKITRNAAGQIINEQISPELKRELTYSKDGYLTHQQVKTQNGGISILDVAYGYDKLGNLTHRTDAHYGSTEQFGYDPMGRIISHIDPHGRFKALINDPAGDRFSTQIKDNTRQGEFEGITYHYNRLGNLIQRDDHNNPANSLKLKWDRNQRLLESQRGNGKQSETTTYRYDQLGRRIEKRTGDNVTFFTWDGDALLGDAKTIAGKPKLSADSRREWVYYPESFEPLALIDTAAHATFHYHNDPNGCPIKLTDDQGKVKWAAHYGVWGNIAELHENSIDNPLRLQGQYADIETGLYYNRYRYYDSHIGSFISQDPIGLEGGLNVYEFAANVFGWVDPWGLSCELKDSLRKAANELEQSGLSKAARSLDKHGLGMRIGNSKLPKPTGGIPLKNKIASEVVDDIINNGAISRRTTGKGVKVLQVMKNDGTGMIFEDLGHNKFSFKYFAENLY